MTAAICSHSSSGHNQCTSVTRHFLLNYVKGVASQTRMLTSSIVHLLTFSSSGDDADAHRLLLNKKFSNVQSPIKRYVVQIWYQGCIEDFFLGRGQYAILNSTASRGDLGKIYINYLVHGLTNSGGGEGGGGIPVCPLCKHTCTYVLMIHYVYLLLATSSVILFNLIFVLLFYVYFGERVFRGEIPGLFPSK